MHKIYPGVGAGFRSFVKSGDRPGNENYFLLLSPMRFSDIVYQYNSIPLEPKRGVAIVASVRTLYFDRRTPRGTDDYTATGIIDT